MIYQNFSHIFEQNFVNMWNGLFESLMKQSKKAIMRMR